MQNAFHPLFCHLNPQKQDVGNKNQDTGGQLNDGVEMKGDWAGKVNQANKTTIDAEMKSS